MVKLSWLWSPLNHFNSIEELCEKQGFQTGLFVHLRETLWESRFWQTVREIFWCHEMIMSYFSHYSTSVIRAHYSDWETAVWEQQIILQMKLCYSNSLHYTPTKTTFWLSVCVFDRVHLYPSIYVGWICILMKLGGNSNDLAVRKIDPWI